MMNSAWGYGSPRESAYSLAGVFVLLWKSRALVLGTGVPLTQPPDARYSSHVEWWSMIADGVDNGSDWLILGLGSYCRLAVLTI